VERARQYAETHGFHTCELAATPRTLALRRALEDRLWHLDGARFVRVMRRPAGATE
jgi:hypothetical protein